MMECSLLFFTNHIEYFYLYLEPSQYCRIKEWPVLEGALKIIMFQSPCCGQDKETYHSQALILLSAYLLNIQYCLQSKGPMNLLSMYEFQRSR